MQFARTKNMVIGVVGALMATTLIAGPSDAHPCDVNLKIYDGQGDDNPVPEAKEETRGALTVLNHNDTDKNGDKDSGQKTVKGEIDLMKLVLEETAPKSEVSWLGVAGSEKIKLWTSSTKSALVSPLEPGGSTWQFDSLPQTLWVEGVKPSDTTKDVTFTFVGAHKEPQPPPAPPPMPTPCGDDKANATIVWAEFTDVKHGEGDKVWKDFGDPPQHALDRRCDGGFGLRPIANDPLGVANCIAMQFTVSPDKVWDLAGVRFDVTRQRQQRTWEDHGQGFILKVADDFPHGDVPNDDLNDDKEIDSSKKPTAKVHMYSIDGPGPTDDNAGNRERLEQRFNMKEFMRVRFDGGGFGGDRVDGSRCSSKFAWHVRHHLTAVKAAPGADKKWVRTGDHNNVGDDLIEKIGDPPGDS